MLEPLRQSVRQWLRVPSEPQAPEGDPASLRVFRAAPNFYRLILVRWGASQLAALIGIGFALGVLHPWFAEHVLGRNAELRLLGWGLLLIEVVGVGVYLVQALVTLAVARLEYELRWYMVTDRSLRIRSGIWTVEELTMTFANIQELTLHQGPLQRWLGIADLRVRSAGGGAAPQDGTAHRETHVGYFRGIDNAAQVRDLILAHVRRYRDSGLGDPDDLADAAPGAATLSDGAVAVAREMLGEARALRALLAPEPSPRAPAEQE